MILRSSLQPIAAGLFLIALAVIVTVCIRLQPPPPTVQQPSVTANEPDRWTKADTQVLLDKMRTSASKAKPTEY